MKYDTTNLHGRCQYVMDRNESARLNAYACARMVWTTFYDHLFFDDSRRGRSISIVDVHTLPTLAAVKKEWRRILGLQKKRPEAPQPIPYYVEMS